MSNLFNYDYSKKLLILGCGGHSKVVTDIANRLGFKDLFYLDSFYEGNLFLNKPVCSEINENFDGYFFVAIGNNYKREQCFMQFKQNNPNASSVTLADPSTYISDNSRINEGVIVMPLCVVNAGSTIDRGVIINTSSSIDHDCNLMSFSSIAPGVSMGGNVQVGRRSTLSIGTLVKQGVTIGDDTVIGGASFVVNNIPGNCVAYGTPAKYIRSRKVDEVYL